MKMYDHIQSYVSCDRASDSHTDPHNHTHKQWNKWNWKNQWKLFIVVVFHVPFSCSGSFSTIDRNSEQQERCVRYLLKSRRKTEMAHAMHATQLYRIVLNFVRRMQTHTYTKAGALATRWVRAFHSNTFTPIKHFHSYTYTCTVTRAPTNITHSTVEFRWDRIVSPRSNTFNGRRRRSQSTHATIEFV